MADHTKSGPVDSGPSGHSLADPLTDAGRITTDYASIWDGPPIPQETGAAKPAASRARRAHETAARGIGFLRDGKHALAIEWLNRSVKLDQSVAAVWHELGVAYSAIGQLQPALAALRGAVSIDPHLGNAHIRLAGVFDVLGRESEAQAAYERGLQLVPSDYRAWARLAEIHLTNARRQEAVTAFFAAADAATPPQTEFYRACAAFVAQQRAEAAALLRALIDNHPGHADAHVLLGQILAEDGQFDEAATSIERGVALNPATVGALSKLVATRRIRADDRGLMERMSAGLERRDLMPRERQALHFALGKGYDDLGDHATAIRHFDAANKIRGLRAKFDRQRWTEHISAIIASAPPGYLERQQNLGVADATPILIVGMPRSGTTLVEQILSSHPDVAAGGELAFWGARHLAGVGIFNAAANPGMIQSLADGYLAVLRAISPHAARVTDKMPFNFLLLGLIRQVFPHATIVHCRRHPIDTCLSIFVTELETGYEFAADRGDLVFIYRSYLRLMEHWRLVLPSSHFIEVDYEALVADPERSIPPLVAGCGLDWDDACLVPHQNARRIATASLWQARQPIYRTSVERWRHYEPWLGELRDLLVDAESAAARPGG
jgi:tetratricopeptide (TPR) repeat protein